MSNSEIFVLNYSHINPTRIYFNWHLSIDSPTDTVETDTFFLSYTNQTTSETVVVNTGNVMNHLLDLSPYTTYTAFCYSINLASAQSPNSPAVTIVTGEGFINYIGANWYVRPYYRTSLMNNTIEDLKDVVTVSSAGAGVQSVQPTFVDIITPSSPKPFYQLYKIDPKGELFGNTPCGFLNFKKRTITL